MTPPPDPTPYRQLAGGPDQTTYRQRLAACTGCAFQTAATCKPTNQLTSVLCRLPLARCPAGLWPDSPPPATTTQNPLTLYQPSTQPTDNRCSVAIICHNQGHFLAEALASIRWQTTKPAQILIIDAASTDNTPATIANSLAQSPEIQTLRADSANLAQARHLAYQNTTGEFLVTLDADDLLGPTYLEQGIAALDRHSSAAIAWTHLDQFGDATGPLTLTAGDINRANWIHSGAVVRRAALDQLAPETAWPNHWNPLSHHDWRLWRCILANGWTAIHSPAKYHYRRHAQSLTYRQRSEATPWPILADLHHEPIEIFVAASGRCQLLDRLYNVLKHASQRHAGPLALRVAVTTQHAPFLDRLSQIATQATRDNLIQSARIYRHHVGTPALADANRRQPDNYRAVQIAMSRLYSKALAETHGEYLWILEDDIEPPPEALPAMLAAFDHNVASVALPYRSRFEDSYVAWSLTEEPFRTRPHSRPAPVGGNGFGCVILRQSFCAGIPIRSDRGGNFDPEFYNDLRARHGIALVDWSRSCTHHR